MLTFTDILVISARWDYPIGDQVPERSRDAMERRYAYLSFEHLADYANSLSEIRLVSTKLAQSENEAEKSG